MINHSPSDIIRFYMIRLGLGTRPSANSAWPIFSNELPNSPDDAISITDSTGYMDDRRMRTGFQLEHPGLHMLVRSTDQEVANKKAQDITHLFEVTFKQRVTIGTTTYTIQNISRKTNVVSLGAEQHFKELEHQNREYKLSRFVYAVNFICTIDSLFENVLLPVPEESTEGIFDYRHKPTRVTSKIYNTTPLPSTTTYVMLFVDGVLVDPATYTLVGSTITLTNAVASSSVLELVWINEG